MTIQSLAIRLVFVCFNFVRHDDQVSVLHDVYKRSSLASTQMQYDVLYAVAACEPLEASKVFH